MRVLDASQGHGAIGSSTEARPTRTPFIFPSVEAGGFGTSNARLAGKTNERWRTPSTMKIWKSTANVYPSDRKPYDVDAWDIDFLGGRCVVGDLVRAYQTRRRLDTDRREELQCTLHEHVREAGGLVPDPINSKAHPTSRRMHLDDFYITNLRFEAGEKLWDEEGEEEITSRQ